MQHLDDLREYVESTPEVFVAKVYEEIVENLSPYDPTRLQKELMHLLMKLQTRTLIDEFTKLQSNIHKQDLQRNIHNYTGLL